MLPILDVLAEHPDSVQECRIAFALLRGPVKGIRALSIASGLHQEQVWEISSSADGGLSPYGLVKTVERGTSWSSEGREKGEYTLAESPRLPHTNTSTYKTPIPLGDKTLKGLEDLEVHRVRFAGGFFDERVMALADPGLDLWRRAKTELGSEGWRVGMILGFQTVTLTAKAWTALVGDEKKAARLAKKLVDHAVLTKAGKARATVYTLDWSVPLQVVETMGREDLRCRARALQKRHAEEQERIQRPASFEEIEVRRRSRNSAQYAAYLQSVLAEAESRGHRKDLEKLLHTFAGASEADWRRWFDAGQSLTEDEVREMAGLPRREVAKQPTPEELALMVRRVTKEPEMPKVPEVLPAQPARADDETEDDRLLRTLCEGDPRIFESTYGRPPNEEAVVDARTQARIDKARRRRSRSTLASAVL
ncbi:hypothetical protein ACPCKL_00600 [Streptomyces cellulosae]